MENAMVKNMSMAFGSEPTELHSSSMVNKTRSFSEEGREKNMNPVISGFGGDVDAYLAGAISSYVESLSQNKMHILEATELHSSSMVKKTKSIREEDREKKMNLIISEIGGDADTYMAGVIFSYVFCIKGYPTNLDFNYSDLAELLHFHINNAGDPFIGNCFSLNSTAFELCVLDWFAKLWEIEKNEYWGYVTTGGTEGNLHGILVGRELFPEGILYTSEESHYSLFKIARMYRMKCVKVCTLTSGKMDCADLKVLLLANNDKPAIINLNIGTTMKGAVDDLDLVIQTLKETNFTHDRFYIHCDGALFGIMLPFIKQAPKITFKKPIGSMAISGHKFLGSPIPCGVVITRLQYINTISNDIEIIASRDATITGSRCGHTPVFLWYTLNKKGFLGLKNDVEKCIEKANYLKNRLRDAGISALLNEFGSTVVLERPLEDEFARKWNLACKGNIAHVVVMQHVTVEMLDSFVSELVQKRLVWYQNGQNYKPPCLADDIGAENCACTLHVKLTIY